MKLSMFVVALGGWMMFSPKFPGAGWVGTVLLAAGLLLVLWAPQSEPRP